MISSIFSFVSTIIVIDSFLPTTLNFWSPSRSTKSFVEFEDDVLEVSDEKYGVPVSEILEASPRVDLNDKTAVWYVVQEILKNRERSAKLDSAKTKEEYYDFLYDFYYNDEVAPYLKKKKGGHREKTTHFSSYTQPVTNGKTFGPCTQVETETKVTVTEDGTGKVVFSYEKDLDDRLKKALAQKFEDSLLYGLVNPSTTKSTRRPDDLYDLTLGDVKAIQGLAKLDGVAIYDVVATIIEDVVEHGHYSKTDPSLALDDVTLDAHRFDNFGKVVVPKAKKILAAMQKYLDDLK